MSTNHTPNYSLSQWQASDQVLRTDFNEDNAKIDAALHMLHTGLAAANAGLAGKVGRAEIVQNYTSSSSTASAHIFDAPVDDWNDYEYVCVLVKYPDSVSGVTPTFTLMGNNTEGRYTEQVLPPLALPGYLVVFLPWHNARRKTAGFVIANRLIPFTSNIPFNALQDLQYSTQTQAVTLPPAVTAFAGK